MLIAHHNLICGEWCDRYCKIRQTALAKDKKGHVQAKVCYAKHDDYFSVFVAQTQDH